MDRTMIILHLSNHPHVLCILATYCNLGAYVQHTPIISMHRVVYDNRDRTLGDK